MTEGALGAALAAGRREHEAIMLDTVRLYRQAPDVFDRATGQTTAGAQTAYYTGPGRVKPLRAINETVEAGERLVDQRRFEVTLPFSTVLPPGTRILRGDRVEVTASPDSRLPGVTLWVTGVEFSSTATAWRISVEDRS